MSDGCQFYLNAKLQCGLPTARDYCDFHRIHNGSPITGVATTDLHQYVTDCNKKHSGVYLTRLQFEGLNFAHILKDCHGLIDFSNSILGKCTFSGNSFSGPFCAINTTFLSTGFDIVFFLSGADFSEARFDGGRIPFDACSFKTDFHERWKDFQTIGFVRAIFEGPAMPFPACCISGIKVSFESAVIKGSSLNLNIFEPSGDVFDSGYLSISSNEINLTNLIFNGHFEYRQISGFKTHAPVVRLERLMFPSMDAAAFIEANLKNARLTYSVMNDVHFINCVWGRLPPKFGRNAVYDHIDQPEHVSDREVLRQYIALKKNYEDQKNFVGASDWSYREMELRKRLSTNPDSDINKEGRHWFSKLMFGLYEWLSDYGESYAKPLKRLGYALIIFSVANLYCGFDWGGESIQYTFDINKFSESGIVDFLKSMGASLSSMIPFFGKAVKETGVHSPLISIIQSVTAAVLIPLFLLALRRKFRR